MKKFISIFKWLYPGMGVKRWIGMSAFGVILLVLGTAYLRAEEFWLAEVLDAVIIISGIIILILGIKRLTRSFIAALMSSSTDTELVDILYQKKHLSRGPKIAAIGGGIYLEYQRYRHGGG